MHGPAGNVAEACPLTACTPNRGLQLLTNPPVRQVTSVLVNNGGPLVAGVGQGGCHLVRPLCNVTSLSEPPCAGSPDRRGRSLCTARKGFVEARRVTRASIIAEPMCERSTESHRKRKDDTVMLCGNPRGCAYLNGIHVLGRSDLSGAAGYSNCSRLLNTPRHISKEQW